MRIWDSSLWALLVFAGPCAAQNVVYVDIDAPPGGDGTSWADAFDDLRDGLATIRAGQEMWIAEGVYETDGAGPFVISQPNTSYFGGFTGTETDRQERDWDVYVTSLSGGFESTILSYSTPEDSSVLFDGMEFAFGFAAGGGPGVVTVDADSTFVNCTFFANEAGLSGGAIRAVGEHAVSIRDCLFVSNIGLSSGGALDLQSGTGTIENTQFFYNIGGNGGAVFAREGFIVRDCQFTGNSATSQGGAIVAVRSRIEQCFFVQNLAPGFGGAIHSVDASIAGCTVAWNYGVGGGVFVQRDTGSTSVINSIVWGNIGGDITGAPASVMWCCLGQSYPGDNNIIADPRLRDAFGGDFQLLPGSPCIDAGNNDLVPPEIATDLDGNPRFVDDPNTPDTGIGTPPIVDMGAYEFQVDTITLTGPVPGLADQDNTWTAADATPGERVYFVYGFGAGVTDVPTCPGVVVGINNAVLFGTADADASGIAAWTTYVPSAASGQAVQFQAVEVSGCAVSNLVPYVFP